jgi:catechol 2,3-dioxygenase-like lactoylglutathione lyase family enzyme
MIKAKRIGHATFVTPDLDRQADYFQQVIGLGVVSRDSNRVLLASPMGQLAVVLEKGGASSCSRIAFEVSPDIGFDDMAKSLSAHGLKSEVRSDDLPGTPKVLTFTDPKGTTIELFSEWSFQNAGSPAVGSAMPNKLGHLAFVCTDPQAMQAFYEKVLGFRMSDWIGDYFVFLRCGIDHHTINFIRGPENKMHHVAFELRDPGHMHNVCDMLGRSNLEIIWGPVRHGPGHNTALYHRNPDDQMIEFFIELDVIADEERGYFEPRPWHKYRPQKPMVWDPNKQRDIWGLPPGPNWHRQTK